MRKRRWLTPQSGGIPRLDTRKTIKVIARCLRLNMAIDLVDTKRIEVNVFVLTIWQRWREYRQTNVGHQDVIVCKLTCSCHTVTSSYCKRTRQLPESRVQSVRRAYQWVTAYLMSRAIAYRGVTQLPNSPPCAYLIGAVFKCCSSGSAKQSERARD